MARHEILNPEDHKNLRVQTATGAAYGDNMMCTLAIPSEFRSLAGDYPVFFHRDAESGRVLPMVMFGFEENENLFLQGDRWEANYLPLLVQKGPFLIGFQGPEDQPSQERMVITVDMDNPRVGMTEGEALFDTFGEATPFTQRVGDILAAIDEGQSQIDSLVAVLSQHDLLESFTLDITLEDGSRNELHGFLTINEEKLAELDGDTLAQMSRSGALQACYMVIASMSQVARLIALKNARVNPGTAE